VYLDTPIAAATAASHLDHGQVLTSAVGAFIGVFALFTIAAFRDLADLRHRVHRRGVQGAEGPPYGAQGEPLMAANREARRLVTELRETADELEAELGVTR